MSRLETVLKDGSPSPKALRDYAKTLLELADAIDAGEVFETKNQTVEHVFIGKLKSGVIEELMPSEPIEHVSCKHDLDLLGFVLAYAHCKASGKFFINSKMTNMVREQLEYLGRRK